MSDSKCCSLGAHVAISQIEEELRAGQLSERQIATRHNVTRFGLRKHKVCLGLAAPPPPSPSAAAPTYPFPTTGLSVEPTTPAAPPTIPTTPALTAKPADGPRAPSAVRLSAAALAINEADQVDYIADLIESGQFYFHRTLVWLERVWRLSPDAVRGRFQVAVEKCSADRQLEIAQKEAQLAALEVVAYEALREFRRLRKTDTTAARGYLNTCMKARTEYSELAGLKTIRHDVNINVWQRTEFIMAVDQFTEAALDVVAPVDASHLLASVQGRLPDAAPEVLEALPEILDVVLAQLQGDAAKRFAEIATQNGQTTSLPVIESSGEPVAAE